MKVEAILKSRPVCSCDVVISSFFQDFVSSRIKKKAPAILADSVVPSKGVRLTGVYRAETRMAIIEIVGLARRVRRLSEFDQGSYLVAPLLI